MSLQKDWEDYNHNLDTALDEAWNKFLVTRALPIVLTGAAIIGLLLIFG